MCNILLLSAEIIDSVRTLYIHLIYINTNIQTLSISISNIKKNLIEITNSMKIFRFKSDTSTSVNLAY